MTPLYPKDLDGKSEEEVAQLTLGIQNLPSYLWLTLKRQNEKTFLWSDYRLDPEHGLNWPATHGYLVGLSEVVSPQDAEKFARQNRITLFSDGGLFLRQTAEIFIRCQGMPEPDRISRQDLYVLTTIRGVHMSVGPQSLLFQRLVRGPIAAVSTKVNQSLADPTTQYSLVIRGIEKAEVPAMAELTLYYLRRTYKGIKFRLWPLPELPSAPPLESGPDVPDPPTTTAPLPDPVGRREAIVFFNRAQESDSISAFLYYYRVLEACFDDVLHHDVENWRRDSRLDTISLLKEIRRIQFKEDLGALRRLIRLLTIASLDELHAQHLIPQATPDALAEQIYLRRNSIAHGRRGQHTSVLVPYGFSSGEMGREDRLWADTMRQFAIQALERWILT